MTCTTIDSSCVLGEFHAIMSFVSAIAKIFEDGGLKVRLKGYCNHRFRCGYIDVYILFYSRMSS